MADYREIAQNYAQGSIKSVILVNGAAAAAVLSQLSTLTNEIPPQFIGYSIIAFVSGVAVGCIAWFVGYLVARYVDRTEREQENDYAKANFWTHVGEATVMVAILFFFVGALLLAVPFLDKAEESEELLSVFPEHQSIAGQKL